LQTKHHQTFCLDAGVNYDFPLNTNLISAKNWDGNTVFLHGPAMSAMELQLCLNKGQVVKTIAKQVVIALVLVKWE
jgi:nicotinate-nucleotide--dimethylbenzimidazole phosphoribosyltransferase